jgi:hypothetical protein
VKEDPVWFLVWLWTHREVLSREFFESARQALAEAVDVELVRRMIREIPRFRPDTPPEVSSNLQTLLEAEEEPSKVFSLVIAGLLPLPLTNELVELYGWEVQLQTVVAKAGGGLQEGETVSSCDGRRLGSVVELLDGLGQARRAGRSSVRLLVSGSLGDREVDFPTDGGRARFHSQFRLVPTF